jgi:hypothetical protein
VAHACNSSYSGGIDHEDHNLKPASSGDTISNIPNSKKAWYSSSSDSLPSKHKALSSNPSAAKK